MNQYYQAFKNSVNDRDFVFKEVLALFETKPINILEIGCARNLDCGLGKSGDGWSSLFFAEYVGSNGGHLDIVELEAQNLENCKLITEDFKDKITYICDDGLNHLKNNNNYDLIYLDGGNDGQQMLDQFECCDRSKTIILCDDFNDKGKCDLLKVKYPDYKLIQVNWLHQMALYNIIK